MAESTTSHNPPPPGTDGRGSSKDRFSVSLTGDALTAVREIAARHGISEGDAVRRAISVLTFLDQQTANGAILRIQLPGAESERLHILYS